MYKYVQKILELPDAPNQIEALITVREYWIVDPIKQRIEQYILPTGSDEYFPAKTHQWGEEIESVAIPGFKIPVQAIFEETANVAALKDLMKE